MKPWLINVINYDDNIDNALLNLKLQLVNDMINIEDYHESLLDAFMIAKYFERCGDRCVNIAKSVIFFQNWSIGGSMAKIVIIEDEEDIRELVLYSLKSNQLEGLGFASGQEFFKADLAEGEIDLILLDVMLPDEDGLQILAKLRSDHRYEDLPIIMLTARSSEMDKVKALDLGADDYVVKPFGILELISRINARLRRSKSNDLLVFNEITIDQSRYEVKVNNQLIELQME